MKLSLILFWIVFAVFQINSQDFDFSKLDYKNDIWVLHHLHALDDVIAIAGESGLVRYSFDFGETWDYTIFDVQAINDVLVINDHTIAVACNGSTLFISDDTCKTWNRFQSNDESNFKALIYNNNKVLAAGTGNVLFEYDISSKDHKFTHIKSSIDIIPEDIEYYAGSKILIVTESGDILFSADLGQTWSVQYTAANKLKAVKAINADIIYAAGDSLITLKSTNGGVDWTDISPVCEECNFVKPHLVSMNFIDEENGSIKIYDDSTYQDYEFATINGGETWLSKKYDIMSGPGWNMSALFYLSSKRGFALSFGSRIYNIEMNENNHSKYISILELPVTGRSAKYFAALDKNNFFGLHNNVLFATKTTDGGKTWEYFEDFEFSDYSNLAFMDIFYLDQNTCLIFGNGRDNKTDSLRYLIVETRNGGETWNVRPMGEYSMNGSFNFVNEKYGTLNYAYGNIAFTTDGGKIWEMSEFEGEENYDWTYFSKFSEDGKLCRINMYKDEDEDEDEDDIITTGIRISYDLGNTWEVFDTKLNDNQYVSNFHFIDDNNRALFVDEVNDGEVSRFMKVTKDGGETWNKISYGDDFTGSILSLDCFGHLIAMSGTDGFIGLFDIETEVLQKFKFQKEKAEINFVKISLPNNDFVIASGSNYDIYFGVRNSTGVFEFFENDNAQTSLYPNPADDLVYFDETQAIEEILILDINSKDLTSLCKINITGEIKSIDISNLQSGTYFVIIKLHDKSYYMKFVKM